MINSNSSCIEILLVEDNPGDVLLTQQAFKTMKLCNRLHVATDGETAIEMLRKEGEYSDFVEPSLILLDMNLPRLDGPGVLKIIKADENLRHIPVIVLTSSKAQEDILKSYDLHANGFISKPVNMNEFVNIVHSIEEFWFKVVTLA